MKTFFFTISKKAAVLAALAVLVVAPMQPLVAQAQSLLTAQQQAAYSNCLALNAQDTAFCSQSLGITPVNAQAPAANTSNSQQPQAVPSSNCALASGGSLLSSGDWAQCITDVVYVFTVGIGSGFAYVSAYFFDWAVALSLNGSAYALDFVSQGWATARDLANMTFLFILLYIAFKIMFEADTSGTVHMLTLVIIIALLVNFSFFFTRLAIDAGNILAIQFYNAIDVPSISSTSGLPGTVVSSLNAVTPSANLAGNTKDLTASIMQMLNLQGLLGNDSFQQFRQGQQSTFLTTLISLSFLYIAAGIMLWGLTVAFVTNGVKFLVRIVVLWFLIIASPLAFAARAVPKFESYYKKWQDALITHAFYPVAFMFIFLILTNFAKQMSGQNGLIGGIFSGINNTPTGSGYVAQMVIAIANVGIRMGFVLAMLYIGMKAAEKIGVMGADAANNAGNWVSGRFKDSFRYSAGWAGGALYRNTGATLANKLDTTLKNSAWANKTGTPGGVIGYRMRKNVLAPLKETSLGTVASSFKERQEFLKVRKTDMQANYRDSENKAILERVASNPSAATDSDKDRLKNMGKRELETLKAGDLTKIAAVLSEDQIKKIADLEKLTDEEKEKVRMEWEQKSAAGPLQKSNKVIAQELRKIRDELSLGGITMGAVNKHTASGATINEATIKLMSTETKDRLAGERARANDRGLTFAERKNAQANVINLQEMQTHLKDLNEQRGKVRPNTDGANKQGEFTVK